MTKQEFISQLRNGLSGLPNDDIEERVRFYSEMIDDHIEDGVSEEQAVSSVGTVTDIVAQVVAETPFVKIAEERIKPKRCLNVWEIVLLVIGSPIWLSLGIAALALILALYVSLWAVIISLWSAFASLSACAVGGVVACAMFMIQGNYASGLVMLAAGFVCIGLAIFMFYGCKLATDGIVLLTKKMTIGAKNCFRNKEVA